MTRTIKQLSKLLQMTQCIKRDPQNGHLGNVYLCLENLLRVN